MGLTNAERALPRGSKSIKISQSSDCAAYQGDAHPILHPDSTASVEADGRLWVALCDVVHVLRESAAWVLLRIESGELRSCDTEGGIYVLAEDLLALVRARIDAARGAGV